MSYFFDYLGSVILFFIAFAHYPAGPDRKFAITCALILACCGSIRSDIKKNEK